MNGRTLYAFTRNIRMTSSISGICTGYSVTKVKLYPDWAIAMQLTISTGYRFKAFDAARAMADENPNEVS
jgi:hypothetical protein